MNKFQRIYDAMEFAKSRGIAKPKIKLGDYTVALVTDGFNAGGLYIYLKNTEDNFKTYIGKVKGDTFYQAQTVYLTGEQIKEIDSILSDPQSFAVAYGQRTGNCCLCGRELTNKESVQYGIGPICMEKVGWLPSKTDDSLLDFL